MFPLVILPLPAKYYYNDYNDASGPNRSREPDDKERTTMGIDKIG